MDRGSSKYADGINRIAEQWPYLRYLGMGAWWAWIWLCYSGTGLFALWPEGSFAWHAGVMYLYSTPAIMLMLILAAVLWRRVTPLLARRGLVVGVSLLAVAGSALIACAPLAGSAAEELLAAGAVLTGMGTSVLALKTGQAYGSLGRHEVLSAGSLSLVIAAFLYFTGTGLPLSWQPAFVAALPLASALLFVMPGDDPFPADELASAPGGLRAPGMRSYLHLVVAAAVVAATAGFAKGVASGSVTDADYAQMGAVVTFLVACAALAIWLVVNTGDIVRAVRRVYAALMFLGVCVVIASAFGVSLLYTGIGKELLWMMFTCLMAYTSFRFGLSPVRTFGFGQAAYFAASTASWWLGIACAPFVDTPSARLVVAAVMVLAIAATFVFIFTDADIKFIFTWHPGEGANATGGRAGVAAAGDGVRGPGASLGDGWRDPASAGAPGDEGAAGTPAPDDLGARVAAIPESYGVSAREVEIMLLFAQGHSANWIADYLVISKNTVRSHIRSIYVKLDVHSREELLAFLERL